MAKKEKEDTKEVEVEPGDDVAEAQPSIEREGAPIGNTGGSGGNPNSAPAGSGGEGGNPV